MADVRYHTIGEAINLLRDEFPELTVSKLRFLENQGLIDPERSDSGYREFSDRDLERIRYILRQQRDHYLPLKVIKSKLTAWERGEEPTLEPPSGPPPETYFSTPTLALSDEELARSAGLTMNQVAALIDNDVLVPKVQDDGTVTFDEESLIIARSAHRLLAHGLEPRHVRSFRLAARREADLLGSLTEPLIRHRNPENRRRAAEVLADTAQAARDLQEAMVRELLREHMEG